MRPSAVSVLSLQCCSAGVMALVAYSSIHALSMREAGLPALTSLHDVVVLTALAKRTRRVLAGKN